MLWIGVLTLIVAAVVSFATTPLAILLARRLGAVDLPGPRKIHRDPVPRLGGIPIAAGLACGLVFAAYATGFLPQNMPVRGLYWGAMALGTLLVFAMGLLDDLFGMSFVSKFAVQIAAALVVWLGGFRISELSLPFGLGTIEFGYGSVLVSLLWILAVTNALNLIDGLDGLAAGLALISTTAVATIALYRGQVAVTAGCVALVGALVGFLRYNLNPARIFLGDSGSMLLGFLLAVLSIHASQKEATAIAILGPVLVVGIPLLDTVLAVLRRAYRLGRAGEGTGRRLSYVVRHATAIFLPDRAHLHHRLLDLGLHQRAAVLVLHLGALLTALAAISLVVTESPWFALAILAALVTFLGAVAVAVVRRARNGSPLWRTSWKPELRDSTATPPE